MDYSIEHIAKMIREARQKKNLSQRQLSAKTGIPQSHISRIEKGAVDLQTTSLIELSRALDLELMLVPRQTVPAVQNLRNILEKQERSQKAQEPNFKNFEKLIKTTQIFSKRFPQITELEKLTTAMKNIQQLPSNLNLTAQLTKLTESLQPTVKLMNSFQKSHSTITEILRNANFQKQLEQIRLATSDLNSLRNAAMHISPYNESIAVPAYRLDEETGNG